MNSVQSVLDGMYFHDQSSQVRLIDTRMQQPLGPHGALCLLFPDFLDGAEVHGLLGQLEARGFAGADSHYPPSYRNNLRQVFDDASLAARLLPRVRGLLNGPASSDRGPPVAINPASGMHRMAARRS